MGRCIVFRHDGAAVDRKAAGDALNAMYQQRWDANQRPERNGFLYEVHAVNGMQIQRVIAPFFSSESHSFQYD